MLRKMVGLESERCCFESSGLNDRFEIRVN